VTAGADQRRVRRIAKLTEASAWALLLVIALPVLVGLVVFVAVLVVLL